MQHYFFHLQDGVFIPDLEGTPFASIKEARNHAIGMSAAVLLRYEKEFWDGTEWQITVIDESGATVFTLNFYADAQTAAP